MKCNDSIQGFCGTRKCGKSHNPISECIGTESAACIDRIKPSAIIFFFFCFFLFQSGHFTDITNNLLNFKLAKRTKKFASLSRVAQQNRRADICTGLRPGQFGGERTIIVGIRRETRKKIWQSYSYTPRVLAR